MSKDAAASGGIIRVVKDRSHPYKTLNTTFATDARLTWGARGVMAYLLSKPDNWQVRADDLISQGPAGKDAVYAILKCLEENGYLRRVREPGPKGHFVWTSYVYEVPQETQPFPGFPYMAEPYMGEPDAVKPDTENPEIYKVRNEISTDQIIKDQDEDEDDARARAIWLETFGYAFPERDRAAISRHVAQGLDLDLWRRACQRTAQGFQPRFDGDRIHRAGYVFKVLASIQAEDASAAPLPAPLSTEARHEQTRIPVDRQPYHRTARPSAQPVGERHAVTIVGLSPTVDR